MSLDPRAPGTAGNRLRTGDQIGPYVILDVIGTGGMGAVYRARDTRLERDVAIKQLSDSATASEAGRARVLREARAAAGLTHPNIAAVYDVLDTPEGLVIVMEYVPGETLAARLAQGPISVDEALRIGMQVADALTEAHDRGVIHRDLKPANVHLTPGGRAKILDFGIARSDAPRAAGADPGSEAGRIVGTPGYMAPEQMSGGRADQRTDIYGVGLLLFEMLTGRRPFDQADLLGSARAIFQGTVPRVSDVDPTIPAHVATLVAQAMALDPADRVPSARVLHGALEQAVRQLSDAPTLDDTDRRVSSHARAWPSTRQRLKQHRLALAIVAVVAAVAALAVWRWARESWFRPVSAHPATLAVLPLQNRSGDPQNDALVLGLTEGLATRLSTLENVRVLSLDESRDVASGEVDSTRAARTLGASFVVEGGMQRNGRTLDVDVALVHSDGRRTPAGRFTGDVSQLFDLHRRVAEALTGALRNAGVGTGGAAEVPPPTRSQEAFADYAQGRLFLERPDVAGSLEHAVKLFQSAIDKDPRFTLAYAGLGRAYWSLYRETNDPAWTARATGAILDALRIEPDQPEVRMALAVMYQGLGRTVEAQEELRRVLAAQPANDDAHRLLASIHVDRGEWDRAIEEVQQAITIRPNYWRNHSELGFANYRAGRLEEAARAYKRVTELQPDSARGFQTLGTVQQSMGDLAAALESYRQANEIRPTAGTHSNIGTVLFWQGDYARAAEAYERAIGLAPNEPDLHANRGDALRKLGRNDDAFRSYQRAIEEMNTRLAVNDKDAQSLAVLAMYLAKVGDRPGAESALARALALSPEDGDVLYNRAIVHALAGNASAACGALERALGRGASAEVVRRADELKPLKGCSAYDHVAGQ